ncbi:MAG TPA: class I SAM-dependent methyltransferase [Dehalococcoidia bacterium]|nr:class I SAM-dependent methyltransferase [Dehalococcoidia bacterium]
MTRHQRFQSGKDEIRKRLLKYTRKAFRMLPQIDRARILDIGCGAGIPTLELARLSQGDVIGIDIDQPALDEFNRKIRKAGLSDRIRAVNCSIFDMDFPDESFDIVWSEGSIYAIGFERGLREWKRFLKPGGFMVIHDEQGNVRRKLKQISSCGYELLGHFILSKETWLAEYFAPLERWIAGSETRDTDDPKILEELHQARLELDMFKKYPERNSSVCFVMRKN